MTETFISVGLFQIGTQVSMKANKIIFYLGTCIQTLMEKEAASLLHI